MATPKLLLDEDVRPLLGEILRQRNYDAIHVLEVGRNGLSDHEQLDYAVGQKRAILTHNIRDFLILDKTFRADGKTHCGILVSDQIAFRDLLRRTLQCLHRYSAEAMHNQVIWLHNFK